MTVTVNVRPKKSPPKFPQVFRHKEFNFLVLFVNSGKGTIIEAGPMGFELAVYSEDWEMHKFEHWFGSVEIKST